MTQQELVIYGIISLIVSIIGVCGIFLENAMPNSNNNDITSDNVSNLDPSKWIFYVIWPIIYTVTFIWHIWFLFINIKRPPINSNDISSTAYKIYLIHSSFKGKLFFGLFILSNILQFFWHLSHSLDATLIESIIVFFYTLGVLLHCNKI